MVHGRWLAAGSPTGTTTYDGVAVDATNGGYPTVAGMAVAVNLTDYDTSDFATGVLYADANHKSCKLTYSATLAAGPSVVMAVAAADC